MKKKEIKNLAKKIAIQEKILEDPSSTVKDIKRAEEEIMKLCSSVNGVEDMVELDDAVQEYLLTL